MKDKVMKLFRMKLLAVSFLTAILSAPLWGATPALPGTLNYVEGQASIGAQTLNAKSVGSINLEAGQTLSLVMVEVKLANGASAPIQVMWSNAVHGPEGPFI